MNDNIITGKIFQELNKQDRSYLYRIQSDDGITGTIFYHDFTLEDIKRSLTEFNRYGGLMNDGTRISMKDSLTNSWLKVPTDLLLPKKYRGAGTVDKLTDILSKEFEAPMFYFNGYKIPDDIIRIYASDFGTDILIPYTWKRLDYSNPFTFFAESIRFKDKEYIHYYSDNQIGPITMNLIGEDEYFDFDSFNQDKLVIYIDGLLSSEPFTAEVNKRNKQIIINSNAFTNKSVEVFYNEFIVYKKTDTYNATNKPERLTFTVDNDFQSSIEGFIPKRTCAFYLDGKRLAVTDIDQIFRQGYAYNKELPKNIQKAVFYVQDSDVHNNAAYKVYGSDYYLESMIGNTRLDKGIRTNISESVFDQVNNFQYDLVSNKNSDLYNDTLADEYIESVYETAADENFKTKLDVLLKRNPSLMRELLRNFSRNVTAYYVNYNGTSTQPLVLGTKKIETETHAVQETLYINWKYVDRSKYEVVNEYENLVIKIPSSLFQKGMNYIEVNETLVVKTRNKVNMIEYTPEMIGVADSSSYKGTLVIPRSVMDQYTTDINHMIIVEYSENEQGYIYANTKKRGYKAFTNYKIDETETTIRINFYELPEKKFLVYFRNFAYSAQIRYAQTEDDNLNSLVEVNLGSTENPIPMIPIGLPELYVNDRYFVYGIDYVFQSPHNNDNLAGSLFNFIRKIKSGDIISFSFDGVDNKEIINASDMKYNSKYGLLYLSKLPFPFHTDYLDVFVNGYKIFNSDIDILSDKLIRIRNIPVPYRDLYIQTKFNIDYIKLEFLFDYYKTDYFEDILAKMFTAVDPNQQYQDPKYPTPDSSYEDFEMTVGENITGVKEPNPENTEENPEDIRQNLLTVMYMKWILSDDARTAFFQNVEISRKVHDMFKIYQFQTIGEDESIIIDGSKAEIVGDEDYHFNANFKPFGIGKRMNMILEAIKKNSKEDFTLDQLWDKFINDPISNIVIPLDFPTKRDKYGKFIGLIDEDIEYFKENTMNPIIVHKETANIIKPDVKIIKTMPQDIKKTSNDVAYFNIITNSEEPLEFKKKILTEGFDFEYTYFENQKMVHIHSTSQGKGYLEIKSGNASVLVSIEYLYKAFIDAKKTSFSFYKNRDLEIPISTNVEIDVLSSDNIVCYYDNDIDTLRLKSSNVCHEIIRLIPKDPALAYAMIELEVEVKELPETELLYEFYNDEPLLNESVSVKINTDAESFELEYDKEALEVTQFADYIVVKGNKVGKEFIKVKAKKDDDHLETEIVLYFDIKDLPQTILQVDNSNIEIFTNGTAYITVHSNGDWYPIAQNTSLQFEKTDTNVLKITSSDQIVEETIVLTAELENHRMNKVPLYIKTIPREKTLLAVNPTTTVKFVDLEDSYNIKTSAEEYTVEFSNKTIGEVLYKTKNTFKVKYNAVGESQIIITAQENEKDPVTEIININVQETPEEIGLKTNVSELVMKMNQRTTILCETDAEELTYGVNGLAYIDIAPDNRVFYITPKSIGQGEISIKAFTDGYKASIVDIPFRVEPMELTELSAEENVTLMKEELITIPVDTNAKHFSIEVQDTTKVKVDRIGKNLSITGLELGKTTIILRAAAEDYEPNIFFITVTVTDQPDTHLVLNTDEEIIQIRKGEVKKLTFDTDATDERYIAVRSGAESLFIAQYKIEDDQRTITLLGKDYGESELYIIAKADLKKEVTISKKIKIIG